jgi:hypothetical protein
MWILAQTIDADQSAFPQTGALQRFAFFRTSITS